MEDELFESERAFEQFKLKVMFRMEQDHQICKNFLEDVLLAFFRAASDAWQQAKAEKLISDSESGCSLQSIEAKVAHTLVPLLTLQQSQVFINSQAFSNGEVDSNNYCQMESREYSAITTQKKRTPKLNQQIIQTIENTSHSPMPWAGSDVIMALLTAIDSSTKFRKPSWQCLAEFAVSVVEVALRNDEGRSRPNRETRWPIKGI